jgi:hypothetical protein
MSDPISSGLMNEIFYQPEVIRAFNNTTGGLRKFTNNQGNIVGNQIRFPFADIDDIATRVQSGSPVVGEQLNASTAIATILPYEKAVFLHQADLASTSSAASLRSLAAMKTVRALENTFTDTILTEMLNYDDTNMEVGSATDSFDTNLFIELDRKCNDNNWGYNNRYLLLPPAAKETLEKDTKFVEIWSSYNGRAVEGSAESVMDNENEIRFVPYRGFMIGFMGIKGTKNKTGLPVVTTTTANDTVMGFCWKPSLVGFGMNQGIQTSITLRKDLQGDPIQFKTGGSCGAKIIDATGVIGIKLQNT